MNRNRAGLSSADQLLHHTLYRILTHQSDVTKREVRVALAYATTLGLFYDVSLDHVTHENVGSELAALLHGVKYYCSYQSHGAYHSITAWADHVRDSEEGQKPSRYTYPHIESGESSL
jgi:hypothetical protein